ncbi:hypothetical protein QKW52_21650 [Bacillus sonorensis]|nr:hypothetical protein [Bacillus sonorensis]
MREIGNPPVSFYAQKRGECLGKRKLSEYQLRRLEETRSKFNELLIHFNYKHVEGEVLNSKIKIKVKCPANHNWSVNYESFKKGVRCPKCRYRESSNRNKLDSKIVIERYRNKGYKLLSEYKNNSSKVKAQCPQGHVWTHNPKDFFRGEGCFECRGAKKHSIDHVKKVFIDRGFIPLFNNYHNNKEKLPFFAEHIRNKAHSMLVTAICPKDWLIAENAIPFSSLAITVTDGKAVYQI